MKQPPFSPLSPNPSSTPFTFSKTIHSNTYTYTKLQNRIRQIHTSHFDTLFSTFHPSSKSCHLLSTLIYDEWITAPQWITVEKQLSKLLLHCLLLYSYSSTTSTTTSTVATIATIATSTTSTTSTTKNDLTQIRQESQTNVEYIYSNQLVVYAALLLRDDCSLDMVWFLASSPWKVAGLEQTDLNGNLVRKKRDLSSCRCRNITLQLPVSSLSNDLILTLLCVVYITIYPCYTPGTSSGNQ